MTEDAFEEKGSAPDPDTLSQRAEHVSAEELRRAWRLMAGGDGSHWERDLRTGTVWYSPQFYRALGLSAPAGREAMLDRIHPDDRSRFEAGYADALQRIDGFGCDVRYRDGDDSYRWARLQVKVWPGADGRPERVVGQATDVHAERSALHELEQHERKLRELVEERTARLQTALGEAERQRVQAQRANDAKSLFLAHMSHELRTPLNGILGLNELALREAASEQQRRHLTLARQSGETLLGIVNDVLDFSRVSAGAQPPRSEPFDLGDVLAEAIRALAPAAHAKGLAVLFDWSDGPTRVIGDWRRIQQVATNLLRNAVKYTETGHLEVVASLQETTGGRGMARIEVRDTGPGMDAETAERVFEPFVQGDGSLARRHGGTGLGLSIARGLAHSMGGLVTVESMPGVGSTFALVVPLQLQPAAPVPLLPPRPGTAWVVEPHEEAARWMRMRLRRQGWQAEIVGDLDALEALAAPREGRDETPPAADLIAIAEAALDGRTNLHRLRARWPAAHIALMVSPEWNQPALEAAARVARIPLVYAPLTAASLADMLSWQQPHMTAPPLSGFAELPRLPGMGSDVLVAEDNPVNQIIVTEMVESLGLQARLAPDGAAAVRECRQRSPALVLMDLQMPGIDGLEATRQLRALQASGELPSFPIVALTAHATSRDRENCLHAGMVGFLTKPVALATLRHELARWVPV